MKRVKAFFTLSFVLFILLAVMPLSVHSLSQELVLDEPLTYKATSRGETEFLFKPTETGWYEFGVDDRDVGTIHLRRDGIDLEFFSDVYQLEADKTYTVAHESGSRWEEDSYTIIASLITSAKLSGDNETIVTRNSNNRLIIEFTPMISGFYDFVENGTDWYEGPLSMYDSAYNSIYDGSFMDEWMYFSGSETYYLDRYGFGDKTTFHISARPAIFMTLKPESERSLSFNGTYRLYTTFTPSVSGEYTFTYHADNDEAHSIRIFNSAFEFCEAKETYSDWDLFSDGDSFSDESITCDMVAGKPYYIIFRRTYGAGIDTNCTVAVHLNKESVPSETGSGGTFTDVFKSDWFYDAVEYVYANRIMQGTSAVTFEPNANLDRAMLVQMLYNFEGQLESGKASFDDVSADAWYADAVAWAAVNEIVTGVGENRFAPTTEITREQMAAMLHRYCVYKNITLPVMRESGTFSDSASVSSWAAEAVDIMYRAGILNGKGEGIFDPAGTAARAEVAQMFKNFMEAI